MKGESPQRSSKPEQVDVGARKRHSRVRRSDAAPCGSNPFGRATSAQVLTDAWSEHLDIVDANVCWSRERVEDGIGDVVRLEHDR